MCEGYKGMLRVILKTQGLQSDCFKKHAYQGIKVQSSGYEGSIKKSIKWLQLGMKPTIVIQ